MDRLHLVAQLKELVSNASQYALRPDTRRGDRGRAEGAGSSQATRGQQGYADHWTR